MKSLFNLDPVKGVLSLFIVTISSCVPEPNHGLDFCLHNTSKGRVYFVFPSKIYGYCMSGLIYEYDDLSEVSPLDTTFVGYQGGRFVSAGAIEKTYSVYEFDELFQYDTLRVFVITIQIINGEEVYDFLVRYDISYNDTSYLMNDDGALELYYPPDERMKNVKMWPKYDDVIMMSDK